MIRPTQLAVLRVELRDFLVVTWGLPARLVRPHLPAGLEPDLWRDASGSWALVSAVCFRNEGMRPAWLPLGGLGFSQVNLRTYVRPAGGGGAGAFFLGMYFSSAAARGLQGLFSGVATRAEIEWGGGQVEREVLVRHEGQLAFRLRVSRGRAADPPPAAELGTFITERPVGWFPRTGGGWGSIRVEHPPVRAEFLSVEECRCPALRGRGLHPGAAEGLAPVALHAGRVLLRIHRPVRAGLG